jgi:hypothetical protein
MNDDFCKQARAKSPAKTLGELAKPPFVVQATIQLGYPEGVIVGLGVILLACTILYLIPRTAVLGAILLTGYLGGAIATNVRVGNPLFTHVMFPVYLAVMLWGGIFLRDERLRADTSARSVRQMRLGIWRARA